MKYAIINTSSAIKVGIRKEYHRMNRTKQKMIVNENELAKFGDPEWNAILLGGKLITVTELNNEINTEEWQQSK